MSTVFQTLLDNIENQSLQFVTNEFKVDITKAINDFFPVLNSQDKKVLFILTTFIIDIISYKYNFQKTEDYYWQWKQNNYRDVKGVILLLLPFIDDKNNSYLLKKLTDLNHLIYSSHTDNIPKKQLLTERDNLLPQYFEFGNMGISLLNPNNDNLLELKKDGDKLIYTLIHHNLIGLLQTLEIINGKCYINWVNIVPLNLNNYYQSNIYIQTRNRLLQFIPLLRSSENDRTNFYNNNLLYYNGLWFGDLYNVIRIKYYEDAKSVKWLFFPYEISDDNKIYLIQGLNKMLNLDNIIQSNVNNYEDLLQEQQLIFKDLLLRIENNLTNNISVTGLLTVDFEIIKYLLIYVINNSKQTFTEDIFENFKLRQEEEKQEDFNPADFRIISNLTNNDILLCLKEVNNKYINHVWTFLKESINLLINSSYGKFLIVNSKVSNRYYYESFNLEINNSNDYQTNVQNKINLKNIYNIAKSLSHDNTNDWNLLDKNYISLNNQNKTNYFLRVYGLISFNNWINLSGNLRRQFIGVSYDYNTKMREMLRAFNTIYVNLVFEELASTGILNKFIINREITDKLILPLDYQPRKAKIRELLKKNFDKNKEWLDAYYYVTNDKFKNLPKLRLAKKKPSSFNDKYNELSYFDLIAEDHEWPIFYAMDWISQISFFQHYIYHQVLYITGATGQGKSTQVPKLLLYALKAIDYKSNGKVICTQPRVPPTVNNATRISDELGVPIEKISNNSITKIRNNNYYVQYKHQADNHVNKNINYGSLKIVTDGTLLEEIKANPTLKTKFNEKFSNNNIYDIVIVDEAHEHNINMDIIIALTRQACYYNNQIKLVIVSATMDDDEPIYRRYFKDINDNLMFPIKSMFNKHPLLDIDNFLPQPVYMDRRYHISPPGETTQYRLEEYYLNYNPIGTALDGKENYKLSSKEAQKEGYKKILEICEKSPNGEILFFANGIAEILEAVEYLNNVLPPGNIALPYHSGVNQIYKDIIEKIDIKISTIRNKRNRVHLEWGDKYIEDPDVPTGTYNRSIIIATNVAEASVTIPNLTFVVDNGFAKVNKYDPVLNVTKLEEEPISESSRVQRRGRVGRIGDGIVYYLYKRDARKFIKPKYKITQEDVAINLVSLLGSKSISDFPIEDIENYGKLIVSNQINPNIYNGLNNPNQETYTFTSGLYEIYRKNYFINNKTLDITYYFYETKITKQSIETEFCAFNDGQLVMNMLDQTGKFFLIHPFENSIKRNVVNQIISFDKKLKNTIPIQEYIYLISYLFNKNLIIDAYAKKPYNSYMLDVRENERKYIKTELGIQVLKLTGVYQTSINDSITLISAAAMGCLTEVMEIRTFLSMGSLSSLMKEDITWAQFYEVYGGSKTDSDLVFIHTIIQKLKNSFGNLFVFNMTTDNFKVMLDQHFDTIIEKFKVLSDKYTEPPTDYPANLWNKLITLKNNGTLNEEYKTVLRIEESTQTLLNKNINRESKRILEWCNRNYLNYNVIVKFMKELGKFYLIKDIMEKNEVFVWAENLRTNFNKYLTTGSINEKIIRSFLYGRPTQFTFRGVKNTKNLQTLQNFTLATVFINKTRTFEEETLTNLSNELSFFLNYYENVALKKELLREDELKIINVSLLSKIEPSWLIPTFPLFFNPMFSQVHSAIATVSNTQQLYYLNSDGYQRLRKELINSWNQDYNIWDSEHTPILRHFYKSISKYFSGLFNY